MMKMVCIVVTPRSADGAPAALEESGNVIAHADDVIGVAIAAALRLRAQRHRPRLGCALRAGGRAAPRLVVLAAVRALVAALLTAGAATAAAAARFLVRRILLRICLRRGCRAFEPLDLPAEQALDRAEMPAVLGRREG